MEGDAAFGPGQCMGNLLFDPRCSAHGYRRLVYDDCVMIQVSANGVSHGKNMGEIRTSISPGRRINGNEDDAPCRTATSARMVNDNLFTATLAVIIESRPGS